MPEGKIYCQGCLLKLDVVIDVVLVVRLVRNCLNRIDRGHIRRDCDCRILSVVPFQPLPLLNSGRRVHALGEP